MDSMLHYCHCDITKQLLAKVLNLQPSTFTNLHTFLLCNHHINTTETLTCIGLLLYAIYNTTNHFRHHPCKDKTTIFNYARQSITEGARRHNASVRVLDGRWVTTLVTHPLPSIPAHI